MSENISEHADNNDLLPFELVVKARLWCNATDDCANCRVERELGIKCGSFNISEAVESWLKVLLKRLESIGKQYSEVTDEEFLQLIQ